VSRPAQPSLARAAAPLGTLLLVAALLPGDARAQGSVSVQGFGYPPGQLGARAASLGGGVGEHDPESSVNPAALGLAPNTRIFLSYAPEFRRVDVGGGVRAERTTALRFPMIGGHARIGERGRIGLAVSTLLDRTFSIAVADTSELAGGTTSISTDRFRNIGGMSDVRFAGAWRFGRRLDVGVGIHAITGQNRIGITRSIGDTLDLAIQDRTLSYSGGALSAGVALQLSTELSVAASLQRGNEIRARAGDTLVSRGRVPDRMGAGLQYGGITGTTLAVRAEYMSWSNMQGLGTAALVAHDTWEFGGGADVAGPKIGTRPILLRAGVRWRELPFGVGTFKATELELGGGLGFHLPFERASAEIGMRRATRNAGSASETGWTLGLGVSVRP
jgi:hypothetical protein